MKDKWINSGYEGEELKPHIEPVEDYSDPARIGDPAWFKSCADPCIGDAAPLFTSLFVAFLEVMVSMGFTPEEIKDSLLNQKYNEVTATYLLLGRKGDVSAANGE